MKRILFALCLAAGIAAMAVPAGAQYMYLDSNGDGVYTTADRMNNDGVPTTVDVWLRTDQKRDGSTAECNTGDGGLTINSYVVNLAAVSGTVTYSGFINRMPFTIAFGEVNSGNSLYKNGFGQQAALAPGLYRLCTLTITGTFGGPSVEIVDIVNGSADFTSFGVACSGNDFDNTYKLSGPGGGSDWTDVDGLPGTGPVSVPPVLAPIGNKTVDELALLSFTATASDPDVGQTLTFSLDAGAPAGASITSGGAFTWTPTEAQGPWTYPITVRVSDNTGTPDDSETIQVTVHEVDQAPVLTAIGNHTVNEGLLLSFTVTATDADIPAVAPSFGLGSGAPAGVSLNHVTGLFTWTPTEAQGPGVYPITITVTDTPDPGLSDSETFQVTVNEVNQAPVLAPIGNKLGFIGDCGTPPITFNASATDADLPPQTLTFSLGTGAPSGATIDPGTGAFSWVPTAAGLFPVTVIVTDNGSPPLADSETIQINVGIADSTPVLAAIGNKTVDEGSLLTFVVTATDACPAPLVFTLGAGAPAGATITQGGTPSTASGTFTWTPSESQGPGVRSVTIIVTGQNGRSDTETIQVTVREVNVAPILAPIGNKVALIGSPLTFTATATDQDLPAQTLTFSLGADAPAGATIGAASGNFSWTPTSTVGAPWSVTVNVTDNGTPPLSDSETISVIPGQFVPPTLAVIGNKTVNEQQLLSFTATATDPDVNTTFTFSLDAGAPAGASISAVGAFTWTPTEAQGPGTYPITVRVTDNGNLSDAETIQVTVNEGNVAPVLAAIGNKSGPYTQLLTFIATATDVDLPAQTLTFSLGEGAPAGATIGASSGIFSWTPPTTGSFPVTIIVTDNGTPPLADSEAILITACDCPNQAPVLAAIGNKTVNEQALLSFTATATDPDVGQVLTFSLAPGAPAGAAITAGGGFTWTPTEVQGPGTYPITVRVTDNGLGNLSDTETIQVTVNEVNQAPVLAAIGNKTALVGTTLQFFTTATDADFPANTLTFSLGAGAPPGAVISASGFFSFSITTSGTFPITVIVTDNGTPALSDSETFQVSTGGINTPPVLGAIGNKTADEQVLLTFTAVATDADVPAQTLTFSLAPGMPPGSSITSGGVFRWTPAESQGGIAWPVTIVVTDNGVGSLSDSETITISVNEDNLPPFLQTPANMTVIEGETVTQQLVALDNDIPPNSITYIKVTGPAFMTVSSAGLVTLTPATGDHGIYTATVGAVDGIHTVTKSFTITVGPAGSAPTADAFGPYRGTVGVDVHFSGSVSSDPNGDPLTYAWDFGDGATATGVSPVHAYAAVGTYVVRLTVSDGLLSDTDLTLAFIDPFFQSLVFTTGGNKTVRLGSGKPEFCVHIEPLNLVYDAADVDLSSIRMVFGTREIPAISGKSIVGGDKNLNGATEITACFSKENLRVLFAGAPTGDYDVALRGDLTTGGYSEGSLTVHVVNNDNLLAATIAPNPLNPKATVSFVTSKAGAVRVRLFDVQGRMIRTLMDEPGAAAGHHDVEFDGQDTNGNKLASGIYYVKVSTFSEGEITKAVTIVK